MPKDTAEVLRSLQTTLKTPFLARPEHLKLLQSAKRLVQLPVFVLMDLSDLRRPQQGHVKSMESEMWLVDAYRRCLSGRAPTEGDVVDTGGTHPSSVLQDLVTLNGALRFTEDHVTEDLSPVDQITVFGKHCECIVQKCTHLGRLPPLVSHLLLLRHCVLTWYGGPKKKSESFFFNLTVFIQE